MNLSSKMVNSLHDITSQNGELGTQHSKINSHIMNLFSPSHATDKISIYFGCSSFPWKLLTAFCTLKAGNRVCLPT